MRTLERIGFSLVVVGIVFILQTTFGDSPDGKLGGGIVCVLAGLLLWWATGSDRDRRVAGFKMLPPRPWPQPPRYKNRKGAGE